MFTIHELKAICDQSAEDVQKFLPGEIVLETSNLTFLVHNFLMAKTRWKCGDEST